MRFNGDKLMKLRIRAGFESRPDFAEAMIQHGAQKHLTKAHIRAWEVLDVMPTAGNVVIMSEILGVEPRELLVPVRPPVRPAAGSASP